MTTEELKALWVSEDNAAIQERLWNRASEFYGTKPVPDCTKDHFLKTLLENDSLGPDARVLDVGCGAGGFSLALADKAGFVQGVDISSGMISHARAHAEKLGLKNTRFDVLNWKTADIDALGFRGAFDVAFAHMTPAVSDYETTEKMNACSRRLCMIQSAPRRWDEVTYGTLEKIGLKQEAYHGMEYLFSYLWGKGYEPHFSYQREVWDYQRTTEEMVLWCVDRAKMMKPDLTPEEEKAIRELVEARDENGIVKEITHATRVTVVWRTDE